VMKSNNDFSWRDVISDDQYKYVVGGSIIPPSVHICSEACNLGKYDCVGKQRLMKQTMLFNKKVALGGLPSILGTLFTYGGRDTVTGEECPMLVPEFATYEVIFNADGNKSCFVKHKTHSLVGKTALEYFMQLFARFGKFTLHLHGIRRTEIEIDINYFLHDDGEEYNYNKVDEVVVSEIVDVEDDVIVEQDEILIPVVEEEDVTIMNALDIGDSVVSIGFNQFVEIEPVCVGNPVGVLVVPEEMVQNPIDNRVSEDLIRMKLMLVFSAGDTNPSFRQLMRNFPLKIIRALMTHMSVEEVGRFIARSFLGYDIFPREVSTDIAQNSSVTHTTYIRKHTPNRVFSFEGYNYLEGPLHYVDARDLMRLIYPQYDDEIDWLRFIEDRFIMVVRRLIDSGVIVVWELSHISFFKEKLIDYNIVFIDVLYDVFATEEEAQQFVHDVSLYATTTLSYRHFSDFLEEKIEYINGYIPIVESSVDLLFSLTPTPNDSLIVMLFNQKCSPVQLTSVTYSNPPKPCKRQNTRSVPEVRQVLMRQTPGIDAFGRVMKQNSELINTPLITKTFRYDLQVDPTTGESRYERVDTGVGVSVPVGFRSLSPSGVYRVFRQPVGGTHLNGVSPPFPFGNHPNLGTFYFPGGFKRNNDPPE